MFTPIIILLPKREREIRKYFNDYSFIIINNLLQYLFSISYVIDQNIDGFRTLACDWTTCARKLWLDRCARPSALHYNAQSYSIRFICCNVSEAHCTDLSNKSVVRKRLSKVQCQGGDGTHYIRVISTTLKPTEMYSLNKSTYLTRMHVLLYTKFSWFYLLEILLLQAYVFTTKSPKHEKVRG